MCTPTWQVWAATACGRSEAPNFKPNPPLRFGLGTSTPDTATYSIRPNCGIEVHKVVHLVAGYDMKNGYHISLQRPLWLLEKGKNQRPSGLIVVCIILSMSLLLI